METKKETIWIVGASSGIGEALARTFAQKGCRLVLSARREDKLLALVESLGSDHEVLPLDVAKASDVDDAVRKVFSQGYSVDRIIFLAALYEPKALDQLDLDFASQLIDVNLKGAFYLVGKAVPRLLEQGFGQLALCGSVAGYVGLPLGQPYSATKAAIINLAESLDAELGHILDIKLISPGFVRSELTDKNKFEMPLMLEPEEAARIIYRGLGRAGFEIHFPRRLTLVLKLLSLLPYGLSRRITRKIKQA